MTKEALPPTHKTYSYPDVVPDNYKSVRAGCQRLSVPASITLVWTSGLLSDPWDVHIASLALEGSLLDNGSERTSTQR